MNRIHHYQGLDSRQKSGMEVTEPASTNNRLTRSLGKSRSSFNNSMSQSITHSIQKGKSSYLSFLEHYYNMHLIEVLADEKLKLLKEFEELFQSMIDQLINLLTLIKQVDFEASNFDELYQTDAEYFSETVYRDIKYLEQQHYEFIFSSSLRFLPNVLECLQFNFEIDIHQFDIRNWAQIGLDHILKYNGLRRSFRQPQSFCQKYQQIKKMNESLVQQRISFFVTEYDQICVKQFTKYPQNTFLYFF